MFLELSLLIQPNIQKIWDKMDFDEAWIPDEWKEVRDALGEMQYNPNQIDMLRFRQLNLESMLVKFNDQRMVREQFLKILDWNDSKEENEISEMKSYVSEHFRGDESELAEVMEMASGRFLDVNLYDCITAFGTLDIANDLNTFNEELNAIPLPKDVKENQLKLPLERLYGKDLTEEDLTQAEKDYWADRNTRYNISFEDVTVDELRRRIETFNNLIVRLPISSTNNKMVSRHIFMDWKRFVDGAVEHMVNNGDEYKQEKTTEERKKFIQDKILYVKRGEDGRWLKSYGKGTDEDEDGNLKVHEFVEIYVDDETTVPLVDYSYLYDTTSINGAMNPYIDPRTEKPHGDRWDYWSEDDFI